MVAEHNETWGSNQAHTDEQTHARRRRSRGGGKERRLEPGPIYKSSNKFLKENPLRKMRHGGQGTQMTEVTGPRTLGIKFKHIQGLPYA